MKEIPTHRGVQWNYANSDKKSIYYAVTDESI